jgi:hypothetical protein
MQEEIAAASFKIFEYYATLVFTKSPIDRYMAIYAPGTDDAKDIGQCEWSQSQAISVVQRFVTGHMVNYAHRVFHIWNVFPPTGMQAGTTERDWSWWAAEGIAIYYNNRALVDLGYLEGNEPMREDFDRYLREFLGTKNDTPVAQAYKLWDVSTDAYFFVTYRKYVYGKDRLPLKLAPGDLAVDWPQLLRALKLSRFPIMTLTFSDSFPKVGQTVSMTAQLVTIDSKPIVNQTITFYLNSTLIGSGTTDQSGLATLTFKVEVDRGTYQVVANYAGSPLFSGTKESAALTVLPMEVTVTSTAGPTSTTQVATETSVLPVQMTWLQVHWPYLVLALMVAAIAVVFVGRRLRSRPR